MVSPRALNDVGTRMDPLQAVRGELAAAEYSVGWPSCMRHSSSSHDFRPKRVPAKWSADSIERRGSSCWQSEPPEKMSSCGWGDFQGSRGTRCGGWAAGHVPLLLSARSWRALTFSKAYLEDIYPLASQGPLEEALYRSFKKNVRKRIYQNGPTAALNEEVKNKTIHTPSLLLQQAPHCKQQVRTFLLSPPF